MDENYSIGLYWLAILAYIIISYLVCAASIHVSERCPQQGEDRVLGEVMPIASSAIAFTTISIFMAIACIVVANQKGYLHNILRVIFNRGDAKLKLLSVVTIIVMILSVVLTAIAEFAGVETVNKCNLLSATTQEEVDNFIGSANMLNRLYGIIIVALIVISFVILAGVVNATLGRNLYNIPERVGDFMSFGRRGRCSTGNKMKKMNKMRRR